MDSADWCEIDTLAGLLQALIAQKGTAGVQLWRGRCTCGARPENLQNPRFFADARAQQGDLTRCMHAKSIHESLLHGGFGRLATAYHAYAALSQVGQGKGHDLLQSLKIMHEPG